MQEWYLYIHLYYFQDINIYKYLFISYLNGWFLNQPFKWIKLTVFRLYYLILLWRNTKKFILNKAIKSF